MSNENKQHQGEPVACAHEWTDDGEFNLTCTKCGKQENHEPYGWVQTRGPSINHFTQEWDVVQEWEDQDIEYKAMHDHADPGEVEQLRAQLAERDVLQWRPFIRGENEPAPDVEVLVRYARQWPNDKVFFVTGGLLHKMFVNMDTLFWINGAGECMGGTVSHWMPMPNPNDALSASTETEVKS